MSNDNHFISMKSVNVYNKCKNHLQSMINALDLGFSGTTQATCLDTSEAQLRLAVNFSSSGISTKPPFCSLLSPEKLQPSWRTSPMTSLSVDASPSSKAFLGRQMFRLQRRPLSQDGEQILGPEGATGTFLL